MLREHLHFYTKTMNRMVQFYLLKMSDESEDIRLNEAFKLKKKNKDKKFL